MTHHVRSDGSTVMATLPTAGTSGGFQMLLLVERPGCRDIPAGLTTADAPPATAAAVLPGGPSPLLQSGCCSLVGVAPAAGLCPAAACSGAALGRCRSGVMSAPCLCRCGYVHTAVTTQQTPELMQPSNAPAMVTGLNSACLCVVMSSAAGEAPYWAQCCQARHMLLCRPHCPAGYVFTQGRMCYFISFICKKAGNYPIATGQRTEDDSTALAGKAWW